MNEACDCLYHVKQIICKLLHGMLHHGSVFQLHVNIVTFLLATEALSSYVHYENTGLARVRQLHFNRYNFSIRINWGQGLRHF